MVSREVVRRLWREECLTVHPRRKRKRLVAANCVPRVSPARTIDDVWALDFQFDYDQQGKPIKVLNVIDEFTRECLGAVVDRSIPAEQVVELLDVLSCERGGRPRVVRMDNGPEFIAGVVADWAAEASDEHTELAFIPPGQPWHNGFVESLHNRMRDELWEDNLVEGVEHARVLHEWWRVRYNTEHP
ncbi:IS3 family transposase, partial [Corynebacterium sp. 13CS0277]